MSYHYYLHRSIISLEWSEHFKVTVCCQAAPNDDGKTVAICVKETLPGTFQLIFVFVANISFFELLLMNLVSKLIAKFWIILGVFLQNLLAIVMSL
jgi:hypothetical protein